MAAIGKNVPDRNIIGNWITLVMPFAESSVRAQLRYLRDLGEVPPGVTW